MTEWHKAQNGLLILRAHRHSIPLDQFHFSEILGMSWEESQWSMKMKEPTPRGKLDAIGHLLFWERPPLSEV
jgi:hypothetical protein